MSMRIRASIALATALMLVVNVSRAAETQPSSVTDPHLAIEPLPDGRLAMSTDTFNLYLREQVALEHCNLRLDVRDKLLKDTAVQAERSWWERHAFWIGLTLGFAGAVGLTWGTVKTLSTAR